MFCPTYRFKRAVDISVEFLKSKGIKNLILDVDNTLATDCSQTPAEGVESWLMELQSAGIKAVIVSNNKQGRVQPFAKRMGLPHVHYALKPSRRGFITARKLLGCEKDTLAIVGDQLFTDILGGGIYGIPTILVDPLAEYEIWLIKMKRYFEKRVIKHYEKRGRCGYER